MKNFSTKHWFANKLIVELEEHFPEKLLALYGYSGFNLTNLNNYVVLNKITAKNFSLSHFITHFTK